MSEVLSVQTILVIGILLIVSISIAIYLYFKGKNTIQLKTIEELIAQKKELLDAVNQEKELNHQAREESQSLRIQLAESERDLKNLHVKHEEYVNDANSMQQRFELLANKILDSKSAKFEQEQKKSLEHVLNPLKEKIRLFEDKVEKTNKESIERHSSLRTQIQYLREINERMTTETQNLTKALKGDSKLQGNWGELILESILEKSGLEKDREYFIQNTFSGESGQKLRPDVIIHLPQDKKIIIDSKVSIRAYEQLINSIDEDEQKSLLKAHAVSIKNHIDGLASKNYHDIYKIDSPDFVLMFIPIDTAFSISLTENPNLYSYAFDKNIVIVTPATLLATLKTVDTMWKNEKQQRYAIEIAEEAGKMYDKFSSLIDDLVALGKRIDQTKGHYEESMKKLHYGRGDLITRAENLKKLGVKVKKQIPPSLVNRAEESN